VRLELANGIRNLALFNMAVDSKIRRCDLVRQSVSDVYIVGQVKEQTSILQSKTKQPVQFEIKEWTRKVSCCMDQQSSNDRILIFWSPPRRPVPNDQA
jgi:hypothetical protein